MAGLSFVPNQRDIARLAAMLKDLQGQARTSWITSVETLAPELLRITGADAVILSVSVGSGFGAAAAGGNELLYSPKSGWTCFSQVGVGGSTPGVLSALQVGVAWNVKQPSDYSGAFVSGSVSASLGAAVVATGSVTPSLDSERVYSLKVGPGAGTPGLGVSAMFENYHMESGVAACHGVLAKAGVGL